MPEYPARAKFSDGLKHICRRRGRLKTQLQPSYTPFRQKKRVAPPKQTHRPNRIRVFQTASAAPNPTLAERKYHEQTYPCARRPRRRAVGNPRPAAVRYLDSGSYHRDRPAADPLPVMEHAAALDRAMQQCAENRTDCRPIDTWPQCVH